MHNKGKNFHSHPSPCGPIITGLQMNMEHMEINKLYARSSEFNGELVEKA